MKIKYFFLTLVYLAVGINAFSSHQEEERGQPIYQAHQVQIPQEITPAEELKNTIKGQVRELIEILKNSKFQQKAFQKGWLNEAEPNHGQLVQFLEDIDPSKKRILQNIDQYFLSKGTACLLYTSDAADE